MNNRKLTRGLARRQAQQAAALRKAAERSGGPAAVLQARHRLFELGRMAEALPMLRRAVEDHPGDVSLGAALAYALASTGAVGPAIAQYRRLLQHEPNSAPLLTNLAVLLIQAEDREAARQMLLRASDLAPEHANTAYTLGELLEKMNQPDQAFKHYRRAVALYSRQIGPNPRPERCNDLVKLASAQFWTGATKEALANFDRAIDLRPDHALALARRGLALAKLRRIPEAITALKRAAAVEPGFSAVRRAIGDLLLKAGRAKAAGRHYRAALQLNPGDELAKYFLAAAEKSEAPDAPPPGYILKLFDEYAQNFEKHLVDTLQYRVPSLLCEAVQQVARPPAATWTIIDLGCGTGLCGPLLRPFASHLIGIDLSAAMLEEAREKSAYDDLIQADIVAALQQRGEPVDLIVSADVLIYLGNLVPLFAAVSGALRSGGWFAFTTEAHEGEGFTLEASGRYRHARAYIESEAMRLGLETVHFRIDRGAPRISRAGNAEPSHHAAA